MKNALILICALFLMQTTHAQLFTKEKVMYDGNSGRGSTDYNLLRWGYFLGVNFMDFNFDYNQDMRDIYNKRTPGFNVGLIGNLRINDFLDLRLEPGLIMSKRELYYSRSYFSGTPSNSDLIREIRSTYIYVPLLLKVSTKRINNFKPFIMGGFAAAINLSSNENNVDDNRNGQFRMKSHPFFYELAFGIDFYLFNFKFSPSIRGVFSMTDELVRDEDPNSPWTGNVRSMQTRGVYLNFTFQ